MRTKLWNDILHMGAFSNKIKILSHNWEYKTRVSYYDKDFFYGQILYFDISIRELYPPLIELDIKHETAKLVLKQYISYRIEKILREINN